MREAVLFAAMLAGLTSRPAATEFAFLVGIPTMFAATAYEFLKARGSGAPEDWNALAMGFVVSGVVAITLSPVMSSRFVHENGHQGKLTTFVNRQFDHVRNAYSRVLDVALGMRGTILVGALLILSPFSAAAIMPLIFPPVPASMNGY